MAVVYEATHESIGRTVALKLISPDVTDAAFVERFRREGEMQAALDHPHVVPVYEAGTSEYGPYLAMRLVRGTTLASLIDDGALTSARTLEPARAGGRARSTPLTRPASSTATSSRATSSWRTATTPTWPTSG